MKIHYVWNSLTPQITGDFNPKYNILCRWRSKLKKFSQQNKKYLWKDSNLRYTHQCSSTQISRLIQFSHMFVSSYLIPGSSAWWKYMLHMELNYSMNNKLYNIYEFSTQNTIICKWRSKLNTFFQQSEKYFGQDSNLGLWLYALMLCHWATYAISSLT